MVVDAIMEIDNPALKFLDDIESKLKDRFSGYLVVAFDGDKIYHVFNSNVTAYGMAKFIEKEIEKDWDKEDLCI